MQIYNAADLRGVGKSCFGGLKQLEITFNCFEIQNYVDTVQNFFLIPKHIKNYSWKTALHSINPLSSLEYSMAENAFHSLMRMHVFLNTFFK